MFQTILPFGTQGRMFPRKRSDKVAENYKVKVSDVARARNGLRLRYWDTEPWGRIP